MSSASEAAWLNYVNVQMNRYFPLPFIILGTIGVILSIIIFTRRSLFNNSCVQYLLANTLTNIVVIYWVIVTRIFSDGYANDESIRSNAFCRIRYFLTYYSRTLSTWFILLACIDRWLSSRQARNRFNAVSFARKVILITCVICFLSYIHIFFLFDIIKTPGSTSLTCYAIPGVYSTFSDCQYLIFYALGPPVLMLIFGLLTLKNVRRNRHIVLPTASIPQQQSINRRDNQLLAMLVLQVLIIIVFTLPFAIQKLVNDFVPAATQTSLEKAQYNLLTAILRLVSYGSHAFGFYFYTLSAKIFRTELLKIFNRIYRFFIGRDLFVVPGRTGFEMTHTKNDGRMTQAISNHRER